jgi:hypothetical protein
MLLNSTGNGSIRIEDLDQEIEGEEPFPSRISSVNFGAKRSGTFAGWIRVMKPVVLFYKRESEISQRDIMPSGIVLKVIMLNVIGPSVVLKNGFN